jgi:hypothetical protein
MASINNIDPIKGFDINKELAENPYSDNVKVSVAKQTVVSDDDIRAVRESLAKMYRDMSSDMEFGAKATKSPSTTLDDRLKHLEAKIANIDSNINKAVQELKEQTLKAHEQTSKAASVHAPPARYEFILTQDDLRELERMLDEIEAIHPPVPEPQTHWQNEYVEPDMLGNQNSAYLEREMKMARPKNGWFSEPDGTQKHYKDGKLHMDGDRPAEVRPNGTQLYYKNGKLHRDNNQPAMTCARGTVKYAVNGKYHRVGGEPAIIWSKSPYAKEWWVNGQIQRVLKRDGTQEWYAPGAADRDEARLHREDGPAVIHPNGRQEFWLDGVQYRTQAAWEDALLHRTTSQEEALDRELIDEDPIEDYVAEKTTEVQEKKEGKKMNKPSFTEILKQNAVDAGYRVAATQSTNIVKNAILTVMRNKGADDGAIAGFAKFLDTEFGAALISFALGSGLHYVPHFSEDPRVQRLAEEMRVNGMATAGNAVIGEAMNHVLPALTQVLQNLPAVEESASNVRVIESSSESRLAEAIEEEENNEVEETIPAKTMKAS